MWTRFVDMHSGGGTKVWQMPDGSFSEGSNWRRPADAQPKEYIYIEAPRDEASVIFYNIFGHNPDRVTCTCCGNDYSYDEAENFAEASGYDRGCRHFDGRYVDEPDDTSRWRTYQTVDDYQARPEVLIIPADQIKAEWRVGDVPTQGFVWI